MLQLVKALAENEGIRIDLKELTYSQNYSSANCNNVIAKKKGLINKAKNFLFRKKGDKFEYEYVPNTGPGDSVEVEKVIWAKITEFRNIRRLRVTIYKGSGSKLLEDFAG